VIILNIIKYFISVICNFDIDNFTSMQQK